jgi:hypothetical protein
LGNLSFSCEECQEYLIEILGKNVIEMVAVIDGRNRNWNQRSGELVSEQEQEEEEEEKKEGEGEERGEEEEWSLSPQELLVGER